MKVFPTVDPSKDAIFPKRLVPGGKKTVPSLSADAAPAWTATGHRHRVLRFFRPPT